MKKILLAGKIDESMISLSKRLSAHYSVRLGSSVPLVITEMLSGFRPDLVVVRLSDTGAGFIARMMSEHSDMPLIAVGTKEEAAALGTEPTALCDDVDGVFNAVCGIFPDTGEVVTRTRVMVVDDDPAMLRTVKLMLAEEYDLMLAPSGAKALKMLERGLPDVILLDYEMPEMNGVEMLAKLRENEGYALVPVIFLTGSSDPAVFDAIGACGVSGQLVKPASAVNIKAAVSSVLEK